MHSGPHLRLGALIGLLPVLLTLLTVVGCSQVSPPDPELLAQARGDQCVEPTDVMRREHMHLLMHERDQAKRLGIRNPEHSFVGCIDCHVAPSASKNEPAGHFCLACHTFNAVKMDCFQCHLDRPATALSGVTGNGLTAFGSGTDPHWAYGLAEATGQPALNP